MTDETTTEGEPAWTLPIAKRTTHLEGDGASDATPTRNPSRAAKRGRSEPGVIETVDMDVFYGDFKAVADVSLSFAFKNEISALIGPSGCGKSTVLRSLNRMNDLIPTRRVSKARSTTTVQNIYASGVDPVEIRRRIGMVFQKPNPVPQVDLRQHRLGSEDQRVQGIEVRLDDLVEQALRAAALWDEVKDKLKESGLSAVGWPAAAAVHRPRHRHPARRRPHGRAVLGARSDRNACASKS